MINSIRSYLLILSQVDYLNYRNEHIWPPTRKWLQILKTFHLASAQIITFDHFLNKYISFWDWCLKFLIFQYWELVFGFLSTIHFNFKMSLSLFPSQILICVTVFAAHNFFFILRLTFGELYCKNIKIKVGRYIDTSLCKYQDHQDNWSIIHNKLEDLFTTITHSFQDFSYTEKCAYITS